MDVFKIKNVKNRTKTFFYIYRMTNSIKVGLLNEKPCKSQENPEKANNNYTKYIKTINIHTKAHKIP